MNINTAAFASFLDRANIGSKTIIEFNGKAFYCKAHPPTRSFVNYQELVVDPEGTMLPQPKRFYTTSLKRLIDVMVVLKRAGKETFDITFDEYNVPKDENNEKSQSYDNVTTIKISASGMKIQARAADASIADTMSYIDDKVLYNLIDKAGDVAIEIDASSKLLTDLINISGMFKEPNKLLNVVVSSQNGVVKFSDKDGRWEIDFNDDYGVIKSTTDFKIIFVTDILDFIDKAAPHTICIKKGKPSVIVIKQSGSESTYISTVTDYVGTK